MYNLLLYAHMLTYRAHILLDNETMQSLKKLAKMQKTTVGKLVRTAIRKTYLTPDPYIERKLALHRILKLRPKVSKKSIDYKALITYGRE